MITVLASVLAPLGLASSFPLTGVVAGALLAGGIAVAVKLVLAVGQRMDGPAGVWMLGLPWIIRLVALATITMIAALAVPDLARALVMSVGTGCIAALLVDLYRQVTARV